MKILINCFEHFYNAIKKEISDEVDYSFSQTESRFDFIQDYFEMKKKIKNNELDKYDVIHIQNWVNLLLIKYKKPHQKWVFTSHGYHLGINRKKALEDSSFIMRSVGNIVSLLFFQKFRNCMMNFDKLFVAIPNLLEDVNKFRPDVVWLPNPIDTEVFYPRNKVEMQGEPAIFFPTRIHSMKSPEKGFEIFEEIKKKYPKAKLHLIKYPDKCCQYEWYEKHLHNVIWHDFVNREDLPELYSSFDLILGSFGKGLLSLVELEAMMCGGCVVTYDKYEIKKEFNELTTLSKLLIENKTVKSQYIKDCRNIVIKNHTNIGEKYKEYLL